MPVSWDIFQMLIVLCMALQRIKLRRTRQQLVGLLPPPFQAGPPTERCVVNVIDAYVPARALRACLRALPSTMCRNNHGGDSDACVHRPLSLKHSSKRKIINDRFSETKVVGFTTVSLMKELMLNTKPS